MKNLLYVYDQAGPDEHRQAEVAWRTYNALTAQIAKDTGHTADIAAAVFAALSPNNDYYGNLRDARRLLEAHQKGLGLADFKVSTYGLNKEKAWKIAGGADPLELIKAKKTRNFYLNIRDPNDPYPVTVDGHIFNAWRGQRIQLNDAKMKNVSKHYDEVAEEIRLIGRVTKTLPNAVQGVIWFTWRRIHGIKFTRQAELWNPEARAAGMEVPYWKPLCDS